MRIPFKSDRAQRFDALYEEEVDPWNFRTSAYEQGKYRATVKALPRHRYRRALEVGCSIGELAARLSERADAVLALDVSQLAIEEARHAHRKIASVRFEVGEVPREWPAGPFDLIVLSEVLYFLSLQEIDALASLVATTLEPGGHCVTVCWLGDTDDECDLGGDEAAERFSMALTAASGQMTRLPVQALAEGVCYRLDLFECAQP